MEAFGDGGSFARNDVAFLSYPHLFVGVRTQKSGPRATPTRANSAQNGPMVVGRSD